MFLSASSIRPWVISQRGLSGRVRATTITTSASTGPIRNASRQPTFGRERVQEDERGERAEDRAGPVAAVDPDVDAAPVLRRHHLVDRGVDRRVLAADPHPRDEPRPVEPGEPDPAAVVDRERREPGAEQVQQQRHDQQPLAPELVRLPSEVRARRPPRRPGRSTRSARSGSRSCRACRAGSSTPVTELEIVICSPSRIHAAPRPGDHAGVERRPAQAVETRRDRAANRLPRRLDGAHPTLLPGSVGGSAVGSVTAAPAARGR